jgi:hypothetical protein
VQRELARGAAAGVPRRARVAARGVDGAGDDGELAGAQRHRARRTTRRRRRCLVVRRTAGGQDLAGHHHPMGNDADGAAGLAAGRPARVDRADDVHAAAGAELEALARAAQIGAAQLAAHEQISVGGDPANRLRSRAGHVTFDHHGAAGGDVGAQRGRVENHGAGRRRGHLGARKRGRGRGGIDGHAALGDEVHLAPGLADATRGRRLTAGEAERRGGQLGPAHAFDLRRRAVASAANPHAAGLVVATTGEHDRAHRRRCASHERAPRNEPPPHH